MLSQWMSPIYPERHGQRYPGRRAIRDIHAFMQDALEQSHPHLNPAPNGPDSPASMNAAYRRAPSGAAGRVPGITDPWKVMS